jgi:ribonuclease BN (tRNA processing enzyme)
VKLTVIGSSPAWPNPGGTQSGYLVEGAGRLLLDCGPGVLSQLRRREHWPSVDAIVVTHFHLDHVGDLVAWLWGHLMGPARGLPRTPLWLPTDGTAQLKELAEPMDETFEIREYVDGESFDAGGYRVTPFALAHFDAGAHGLRITDGRSTLAYSGDTGPTPALVELARGADLFLCEATLSTGDADGPTRGHLSVEEAVAAGTEAAAARLLLTHRPMELPVPPELELASDGLVRDV